MLSVKYPFLLTFSLWAANLAAVANGDLSCQEVNCDFPNSTCGWKSSRDEHYNLNWTLGKGWKYGGGMESQHYAHIDFRLTTKGDKGRLVSPWVVSQPVHSCLLSFRYLLEGSHGCRLSLHQTIFEANGTQTVLDLWNASVARMNSSGKTENVSIYCYRGARYQVFFAAERLNGTPGSCGTDAQIAIDDISCTTVTTGTPEARTTKYSTTEHNTAEFNITEHKLTKFNVTEQRTYKTTTASLVTLQPTGLPAEGAAVSEHELVYILVVVGVVAVAVVTVIVFVVCHLRRLKNINWSNHEYANIADKSIANVVSESTCPRCLHASTGGVTTLHQTQVDQNSLKRAVLVDTFDDDIYSHVFINDDGLVVASAAVSTAASQLHDNPPESDPYSCICTNLKKADDSVLLRSALPLAAANCEGVYSQLNACCKQEPYLDTSYNTNTMEDNTYNHLSEASVKSSSLNLLHLPANEKIPQAAASITRPVVIVNVDKDDDGDYSQTGQCIGLATTPSDLYYQHH